jgi:hypothetical protein
MIFETSRDWDAEQAYIACCGNFTIERTLAPRKWALHSNDVSMYTTALGWWLTGQPVPVRVSEDYAEELAWLAPYLDDGIGTVATIMLGTRWFGSIGRTGPWHTRVVRSHREQMARMHAETVAKLRKAPLKLASYSAMDVREFLDQVVPPQAPLLSFPPFYAGGYESLYKPLERVLTWPAPAYTVLTDEDIASVTTAMTDRPTWMIGINKEIEALSEYKRGVVQPTPRAAKFYVYASKARSRIVAPRQRTEPVSNPRLVPGLTIGDRLALAYLTPGQFNALRAQYLNPRIAPGGAMAAIAVLCDGLLIGAYGVEPHHFIPDGCYLQSDFAVAPTDYPRLSRLVLLAATSKESQRLAQRALNRRVTFATTTAFTDKPVSMKYRGLFDLHQRKDSVDPNFKYQLQYGRSIGTHTLEEALSLWKKKHLSTASTTS